MHPSSSPKVPRPTATSTPSSPSGAEALTFVVPPSLDGARVDKAVVELASGLSRARIKRAIELGAVRVNGRVRAKGALVAAGDTLEVAADAAAPTDAPPPNEPDALLEACFVSEHAAVVCKPAGQPTAPLKPGELGTLAGAVLARFPETASVGYARREPGLLHRLDTETSGLVIVARSAAAFDELKAALREERIEKRYLLLCPSDGLPDTGTIAFPLANHPKDQRRVYPCIHPRDVIRYSPRPASTDYTVVGRGPHFALVEARAHRALRHQIRAHFAAIGHPLAGDTLYGGPSAPGLTRHALHASRVRYEGGAVVPSFDVTRELPPDMQAAFALGDAAGLP